MKKTLAFILSIVMMLSILSVAPITASAAEVDTASTSKEYYGYTYTTNDNGTATIVDYPYYYSGITIIPSEIEGYTVTAIGKQAFMGCAYLDDVKIPDTVTSIGAYAFQGCDDIWELTIPESVETIGEGAIDCEIQKVYFLSDDVEIADAENTIDPSVIIYCNPNSTAWYYAKKYNREVASFSSEYEYRVLDDGTAEITEYTGGITKAYIPSELGGYTVSSIGDNAFINIYLLGTVEIPDTVSTIGKGAFASCENLESIEISEFVTSIGEGLVGNCDELASITVDENNPVYDSRENCNAIIETATNILHSGCNGTVIPDSVTAIGNNAFYGYCNETITIPNSVTSIGDGVFLGSDITNITIPDSVTTIGEEAFFLSNITEIVVPDSVTHIGAGAFKDCYDLTSVTLSNSLTAIPDKLFSSSYNITEIVIPESVTSIGYEAFSHCDGLTELIIPESVDYIGSSAFEYCDSLRKMAIYNPNCEIVDCVTSNVSATIYGFANSTAEAYADSYDLTFIGFDKVNNVRVGNIGADSFTVNWDEYEGAVKYYVYTDPTTKSGVYTSTTETYAEVTGRKMGKSYQIAVIALLEDGSLLDLSKAEVLDVNIGKVQSIEVENVYDRSFTVSWDETTSASFYYVYVNGVAYKKTYSTSLTVENRNPSTEYTVSVVPVFDDVKMLPVSEALSVTVKTDVDYNSYEVYYYVSEDNNLDIYWNQYNDSYKYWIFKNGVCVDTVTDDTYYMLENYKDGDVISVRGMYDVNGAAKTFEYTPVTVSTAYEIYYYVNDTNSIGLSWSQFGGTYKYWIFKNGICVASVTDDTYYTLNNCKDGDVISITGAYAVDGGTKNVEYAPVTISLEY